MPIKIIAALTLKTQFQLIGAVKREREEFIKNVRILLWMHKKILPHKKPIFKFRLLQFLPNAKTT